MTQRFYVTSTKKIDQLLVEEETPFVEALYSLFAEVQLLPNIEEVKNYTIYHITTEKKTE